MSDETKSKTAARSAFELALASVGLWFSVSCLMALAGNAPSASIVTRPVVLVMGWIGVWPTLAASLGIAAVGTWSFLVRDDVPWVQHTLGAIGVGLGLALGLGAFRPGAGGELGLVLPSLLPGALGVSAGAGVGLAVLLATAWMAWLPGETGFSRKPGEAGALRAAGIPDEGGGVSREEARALIAEPPRPPAPVLPHTPSLRDDVRTRGGVPAGTRPLPGTDDRTPFKTADPALPGGEAPAGPRAGQPAGPHLAAPGAQPLRAGGLLGRQVRPEEPVVPRATPALRDTALPLVDGVVPVQPSWERAGPAFPAAGAEAPAEEAEDEAGAAWEALDAPPEATAWEAAEDELLAREEDEQEEDEDEHEDEDEELDEEDEDVELLVESEDERAPVLELDELAGEVEEEVEEQEEELDELALEPDAGEPGAEPGVLGAETLEPGPVEELAQQAPAPQEAAEAPPSEETAPAPAPKRERRKKRPAPIAQSSLFDEGRPDAPADELAVIEIPAVAPAPPLTGAAGAAGAARRAAGAAPSELLLEAGNLILDQNRVAVSMLQRRFGLGFDAATEVLDQLQALGLIGPYLGGKTRDILLSREEWMALAQGV